MRTVARGWLVASLSCCLLVSAPAAFAEKRIALVIGNARYPTIPLNNPENDARVISATLRKLGFEVTERVNLGVRDFRRALREFAARTQDEEGVAVLFYAGHGVQIDGRNYLLPVDINLRDEEEVKDDAVDIDDLFLRRIERARAQVRIVILDACRDNPFRGKTRNVRPVGGLADLKSNGALIAYSSAPGATAEDGPAGTNSVYTRSLSKEMLVEGLEVEQMFKQVRLGVLRETEGRQMPWDNSSLTTNFSFNPRRGLTKEELAKQREIQDLMARLDQREREQKTLEERARRLEDELKQQRQSPQAQPRQPVVPPPEVTAPKPIPVPPPKPEIAKPTPQPAQREPIVPPPVAPVAQPPVARPLPSPKPPSESPAPKVVVAAATRSEQCNALLIRASLGEPMRPADLKFLKEECK